MDMTDAPGASTRPALALSVADDAAWMGLRWREPDATQADAAARRLGFAQAPARGHWLARAQGAWLLNLSGFEWLVSGTPADIEHLLAAWHEGTDTLADVHAFDQADRWVCCTVSGPAARALLAQGCGLDLRATRFGAGQVAAILFARVDAVLACASDELFHLLVERPLGDYLHRWLSAAIDAHLARRSP